ncbi:putative outer membrane transport/efflux protein [Flavobacterium columnare ATCC 49512]|uniref:Outer membrane transport/efflux protein n=1 Tax=Flavobacterium columnare (strain ATCC 49512 / CIP 103533 / TG 44/87) TaxID=1041826 RepID=G8X7N0_FLACA|nr:TolC family protein [Flavobacterium columnare]AEW85743.1 putative outer membrane transport/efflux protein [Flavobacterium columnare ATCC 49512]
MEETKTMKKTSHILIFLIFIGFGTKGQEKKWTLKECVNHALVNNIVIQQSSLDAEIAVVNKKMAFARFLPSISGTVSHSWNIGLNQNITTGLLENQTTQFTSAGITFGIDIYKGLQNQNQLRKANLSKIASEYQLTKIKEDISLNVINAYLQVLFNKESLKVQQEQLIFSTEQKKKTTELVNAGVVPKGDLLDMNATIATNTQRVVSAENAVLISKLSLAQLLQLKEYDTFDIADTEVEAKLSAVLAETPNVIVNKAKQTRVELKLAQTNLEIAQKDIDIAKGAYQPNLQGYYNLNTRVSYAKMIKGFEIDSQNPIKKIGFVQSTGDLVSSVNTVPVLGEASPFFQQINDNKGHSFGLQLSIPIFNGFAVKNNVNRSKIIFQKSKLALEQQMLDLERTVYTAYTDTRGAQKAYEAALVVLQARQKAVDYAKERYEVGLMNVFDYNQSQTQLSNAESEVLRTKYDYIFRTKILEFYFGIPIF